MEKEHVTGKVDEVKGKAKQGIGDATDDAGLKTEGVIDEGKGKLKQAYGDLKDTIKHGDKQAGTDVKGR
jgi:uncharacterized protein YjbJ (UPF0337 family)